MEKNQTSSCMRFIPFGLEKIFHQLLCFFKRKTGKSLKCQCRYFFLLIRKNAQKGNLDVQRDLVSSVDVISKEVDNYQKKTHFS